MRRYCEKCERGYNDELCSTLCPHKGIGFCVVCDCTFCICNKNTSPDWDRSSKNMSSSSEDSDGKA